LPFSVQRKAKEQEERAVEQERICKGLEELNYAEKENFARYDFVSFTICCQNLGGQWPLIHVLLTLFYINISLVLPEAQSSSQNFM
jgi:hypothetical protein